jgi:cytochrome c
MTRTIGAAVVGVSLMLTAGAALAEGDPAAGQKVFNKCRACHVVEQPQNRVGPTLNGVIGRPAGSVEGFNYSDAMKNSGIVWTEETIAEYIADPKGYVPGNRMAFAGLKKEEDVVNVIAYIKENGGTAGGS